MAPLAPSPSCQAAADGSDAHWEPITQLLVRARDYSRSADDIYGRSC